MRSSGWCFKWPFRGPFTESWPVPLATDAGLAAGDDHVAVVRVDEVLEELGREELVPGIAGDASKGLVREEDVRSVIQPDAAAHSVDQAGVGVGLIERTRRRVQRHGSGTTLVRSVLHPHNDERPSLHTGLDAEDRVVW